MQDRFRVVGVRDVAADSKDISTFFNVVLEIIVGTLVRELGHFNSKKRGTYKIQRMVLTFLKQIIRRGRTSQD